MSLKLFIARECSKQTFKAAIGLLLLSKPNTMTVDLVLRKLERPSIDWLANLRLSMYTYRD